MGAKLIYVTAPDRETALTIARTLVHERRIACANVWDGATSLYRWEGVVEQQPEAILIAKTTSDKVSETISRILELHPYSCPCVVALEIAEGNPAFLRWIAEETKEPAG